MARLLLVDDDPDQLEVRRLLAEQAGHETATARDAAAARACFAEFHPEVVVLDLRIPSSEDGLSLIRELHAADPSPRLLVLSGWPADIEGRPEASMAEKVLAKPVHPKKLLDLIARLAMLLAFVMTPVLAQGPFRFHVAHAAEVTADLDLASPGSNWGQEGREAALADVLLDGKFSQNVMVSTGPDRHTYPIFLGELAAGDHTMAVRRNTQSSAPASGLKVLGARFREIAAGDAGYTVLSHAPVLFARRNTIGKFTDIPLIVYAERLTDGGQPLLQYTVIFSNEDGGTSTRALMARWGRTTDVEYVYKAWLDPQGRVARATIQASGHKEIEFGGRREGQHPLLIPVTDNNMVSDGEPSAIRYQIAPVLADLSHHSREETIDEQPFAYRIMAEELAREGKIRPFGVVDGQKISDPRNYLYIEARVENDHSGIFALTRLKNETRWRSSNLGREDYAIERGGWVQTTIELPPGTKPSDIAGLGFGCIVVRPGRHELPVSGACRLDAIGKAFFLSPGYTPGTSFRSLPEGSGVSIPAGEIVTFPR
jgi:CheY-like chemotaxis protein